MTLHEVKQGNTALHLSGGEVRIECPECGHWQPIKKPAGATHCGRCRLLLKYDTGYGDNQFFRFRMQALQNPDQYRKVG